MTNIWQWCCCVQEFDFLRTLYMKDNALYGLTSQDDHDTSFQYSLYRLDVSGRSNAPMAIQQMRRWASPAYICCCSSRGSWLFCLFILLEIGFDFNDLTSLWNIFHSFLAFKYCRLLIFPDSSGELQIHVKTNLYKLDINYCRICCLAWQVSLVY